MTETSSNAPATPGYTLWQMVRYMLALGTWGFGGPVALVGYMYRDLVEKRSWISESDYKEGMALAQLMPGPLAAQLAIYLGYVHYRVLGATLVGMAFVLPSFLMVVAIGAAYTAFGGIAWMQAVFYGVGAAVIGIIAMSAYKLTTKNIGKDRLLWVIFAVSAAVTVITKSEVIWVFLGAGALVWLLYGLLCGYGFAWIGHFFFEKNRPATFKYPLYSFIGDWVMYADIWRGRVKL